MGLVRRHPARCFRGGAAVLLGGLEVFAADDARASETRPGLRLLTRDKTEAPPRARVTTVRRRGCRTNRSEIRSVNYLWDTTMNGATETRINGRALLQRPEFASFLPPLVEPADLAALRDSLRP